MGYEPIYRQRSGIKSKLGFQLLLDLGALPTFDLEFDSLLDVRSSLDLQGFSNL